MSILGTRVIRTEDPRLLTAGGVYVDDLRTPELNAAARLTFVRSPLAHARITGIDTSEALSEPGVVAVLTVRDMDDLAPPPPGSGEREGGPLPLADCAAITAPDLPSYELVTSETPTTLNPLGVKGIGEAGTIGSTPAIQDAVVDAVAHLGIRHIDMPTTPQRVWTAINEARKASNQ